MEDYTFDQFLLSDLIVSGRNQRATMLISSIYEGLAMLPALLLACKMNRTIGYAWL